MRKKVTIIAIVCFAVILCIPYLLNENASEKLTNSLNILSALSSFITLVIAILLYDKYGIDKSIKDKNLETSLSLLEEIKKLAIFIDGKGFMQYRPTSFPITLYEDSYSVKLLFSTDYFEKIKFLVDYSSNLYLPDSIKSKLDVLIPNVMSQISDDKDTESYGKVTIGKRSENMEWKLDKINDEEITLYDYLLQWEELITSIKSWCKEHSDTKIDLNIK